MERNKVSVLLVSVDALKPEFVFEQERLGISLPNISKYFVENGTFAGGGVQSVFPTFTYPCHQSIITGTNPATHGIYNNGIFDPLGEHMGAWHWFASRKVENLWEAAGKHGYLSASVAFPTSVAAGGDFIAPEFWWDGTELDSRFIDAMSVPQGMILEMEKDIGRYAGGLDLTEAGDRQRYRAAMWVLDHKIAPRTKERPFFMSAYFASFDEAIQDFEVEELPPEDEKDTSKSYTIDALHRKVGSQEMASIPLKQESSGTLKMFALYPSLKDVLDNGGTLFVDELNARLHPLLVRNIILTFLSPEINTQNAQLVFTTHDIWQFSNELLRRDEIWMVNKNKDGVSELYSLAEFKDEDGNKVRRDEALAKNYLTGNYGAIPALKPMKMLTGRAADDE